MPEQNLPTELTEPLHHEYDVDAPADAQPDFDAELTEEADEVFEDEAGDDTNDTEETTA